jgi:RimJ/RimL family protein N-acetyltransferase
MIALAAWGSLSPEQRAAVRGLQVSALQVEYAGTIEAAVAQCEAGPDGDLVGVAVLAEAAAVGFLVLKRGAKAPGWASPGAAVVSALRIAQTSQGRGYGTQALRALPGWVALHWPDIETITLSVDEENHAARVSYAKAGWVDHGVRVEGRIGWVRYMSRPQ